MATGAGGTSRRQAPKPLGIWELLPQTNCRRCGELTCTAFAFGLLQQRHELSECRVLVEDEAFADRHSPLMTILG